MGHPSYPPEGFRTLDPTKFVLEQIRMDRREEDKKYGEQSHPDGTGVAEHANMARLAIEAMDDTIARNPDDVTWAGLMTEEYWISMTKEHPEDLRVALIDLCVTAVAWIEDLDRRKNARVSKPKALQDG